MKIISLILTLISTPLMAAEVKNSTESQTSMEDYYSSDDYDSDDSTDQEMIQKLQRNQERLVTLFNSEQSMRIIQSSTDEEGYSSDDSSSDEEMDLEIEKNKLSFELPLHLQRSTNTFKLLAANQGISSAKIQETKTQLNQFYEIALKVNEQDLDDHELLRERHKEISDLQDSINNNLCPTGRGLDYNGDHMGKYRMSIIKDLNTIVNIIGDLYPDMDEDS